MPKRLSNWVPKQDREFLTCKGCGKDKPPHDFLTHGKTKSGYLAYHSRCRECYWVHTRSLPHFTILLDEKRSIVDRVKVKCSVCGYDRCKDALDFHHIDSSMKLFGIAEVMSSTVVTAKELQDEIAKCVVLCSNCHREHHAAARN